MKTNKDDLNNLLSHLQLDFEEFLPIEMPLNFTSNNISQTLTDLQKNKSSDRTLNFHKTLESLKSEINKSINRNYNQLNDSLLNFQNLYLKYENLQNSIKKVEKEFLQIKTKIFIDFDNLIKSDEQKNSEKILFFLHKKILKMKNFITKFQEEGRFIKKYLEISIFSKNIKIETQKKLFDKKLIFYKNKLIEYLLLIEKYELDENDFILEMKIELIEIRKRILKYLCKKILENIFLENSINLLVCLEIIIEFDQIYELDFFLTSSFKKLLFVFLNRICKKNSLEIFNLNSINFSTFDLRKLKKKNNTQITENDNLFENEILNFVCRISKNIEDLHEIYAEINKNKSIKIDLKNVELKFFVKENIFVRTCFMTEIKRIFGISRDADPFQINNILNIKIEVPEILRRKLKEPNEISYGDYKIFKKNLQVNVNRLINLANLIYKGEYKENKVLKNISDFCSEELRKNLKHVDSKINFFVRDLMFKHNSLDGDPMTKRLRFFPQFLKKMHKYKKCINFLNFTQYFLLIKDKITAKYELETLKREEEKLKDLKSLYLTSGDIYDKKMFIELLYTIFTISDLKNFLIESTSLDLENINPSEIITTSQNSKENSEILIKIFDDLHNSLRSLERVKFFTTIYFYFDKSITEGIIFKENLENLFYGFSTEKNLIKEISYGKKWAFEKFLVENQNLKIKKNLFFGLKVDGEVKEKEIKREVYKKIEDFYFSFVFDKINEYIQIYANKIKNKGRVVKDLMFLEEMLCLLSEGSYGKYDFKDLKKHSFYNSYEILNESLQK